MKRIAILRYNLSHVGGAEKVAVNLANALSADYQVHLLSMTMDGTGLAFDLDPAVHFHNFFQGNPRVRELTWKASRALRTYLKQHGIELVFSIAPATNTIMLLACMGTGIKTVFCDHHSLAFDDGRGRRVQRYLGAKFADKVVSLTDEDRGNYIEKYHLKADKVSFIYNWLEALDGQPEIDMTAKKILTVGRLSQQKGYDLLAKVASQVLPANPDWTWDIYGEGHDSIKADLVASLEAAGCLQQVDFKGNVKGMNHIYPGHSLYVMTSYHEGLPLVLLEAKQYGLPIVSFACPTGPSEIVSDGLNGYLVAPYDVDLMVTRIQTLIDDADLRQSMSDRSMDDTEKFDKARILAQWQGLIHELLGE